jgi:hypothetical protein
LIIWQIVKNKVKKFEAESNILIQVRRVKIYKRLSIAFGCDVDGKGKEVIDGVIEVPNFFK